MELGGRDKVVHRDGRYWVGWDKRESGLQFSMEQEQQWVTIGAYRFSQKYCLGQGSYGKVYRGTRIADNLTVAIKEIDVNLVDEHMILNQANLLKQLNHPNIVAYHDIFRTPSFFYLIIEYCNKGNLSQLLAEDSDGEVTESEVQNMFFQVCEGFQYLKQFNILHRDLKPDNVMIHNGVYKIGDFGLAKAENLATGAMTKTHVGSPIYMAPQILSKNYYTFKCDVWSLGVIFFELLFGEMPWKTVDVGNILFKIMEDPNPHLHMGRKVSELSKVLVEGTLRYLQKDRLTFEQLLSQRKSSPTRKKIFDQSLPSKTRVTPLTPEHYIDSSLQFSNFDFHKYNNDLQSFQRQILKHIYSQLFSLKEQIERLTNRYCLRVLISTCHNYMISGSQKQQEFRDCCKVFLKLGSENMSSYVIELESWEEARELLSLIELIHDFATLKYSNFEEYQRTFERSMPAKIDIYAAVVISKINTFARNH